MVQNETATTIAYAFTTGSAALSIAGSLLIVFVILFYGKYSRQSERLVLGLSLAHIPLTIYDLRPPHASEYSHLAFVVYAGLFQSMRFVISLYEIFILVVSLSAVKRKLALEGKMETIGHVLCWVLGSAMGVGYSLHSYFNTDDTFAAYKASLPDALTYVWLILVLLSLLPFMMLEREVANQEQSKRFAYDPDMDSKMDRTRKEKLASLWLDLMSSTVRPLRAFPIIFFLSALGEIGLMVLRDRQHDSHAVLHIALTATFNCLIDIRGFLNTLAYFRNDETREELTITRLRGQFRRQRRRIGRTNAKVKFGAVSIPADSEDQYSRHDEMSEVNTPLMHDSQRQEEQEEDVEIGTGSKFTKAYAQGKNLVD